MKALNRLLIADVSATWRQGLAISLLLACGVATFVMSTSAMKSLAISRDRYYEDFHFADVFVQVTRAPNQIKSRIMEIPGVASVQTRVVRNVILDLPAIEEPVSCRLVSIEPDSEQNLNKVFLKRGALPDFASRSEVVASELFADAHGFSPRDEVNVIMGGRKERLRVTGIGASPETVYLTQPGMMLTDNRRFGVLWMPRRQMDAAFNMEGSFNDATIQLHPSASQEEVLFQIDRLLERFGGQGAYLRKDQESHHRLSDEMHQMRGMAYVTPCIFLAVTAFLSNIVLSRLINLRQEQIATLRAFGYRPAEIGIHYFKLLIILVTIGGIVGNLAGLPLSWWMTNQYGRFFRFPVLYHEFAVPEAAFAIGAGFASVLLGSVVAIRRAIRVQPAVAMQPEAPRTGPKSIVDSFGSYVTPVTHLIIRRLETNRRSTILSVLGIAMGLAVSILGGFMESMIDFMIDVQFHHAQRQDVTLTFNETLSANALHDVLSLPGVFQGEGFRAVTVRLRNGTQKYRLSLLGLQEEPQLFRVLDEHQRSIHLPDQGGLTISKKLAEILNVRKGDEVIVELLEYGHKSLKMPISEVFTDYSNPSAYLNRIELHRLLREGERFSGAFLAVDANEIGNFYLTVKTLPSIAGVLDNRAAILHFRKSISDNTSVMRIVNAVFASIIAFGVIFNCALITLAERGRDLATLRVLGFTLFEVSAVLVGELAIISALAIPVGIPIGYAFSYLATVALDTESHRFPLVISRVAFANATITILLVAAFCSLIVRQQLSRLNLIAILKVKE